MVAPVVAAAAIPAGVSLVSNIANLWLNLRGIKEQRKEARRAERLQLELYEKAGVREERLTREERRFRTEELEKERRYKNSQTFLDNIVGLMNRRPQYISQLMQIQKARL